MRLYNCLIEEQRDEKAFVQMYWARAEHIGDAIEKIVAAARRNGLSNPKPMELDPYEIEDLECEVAPDTDADVFWAVDRYFFPPEPNFTLPYGVIPSGIREGNDAVDIAPGFMRRKDQEGRTAIEVNVERDDLLRVYGRVLSVRDSYRVFWYQLHDHWDDTPEQFLVNRSLDTPQAIVEHLTGNKLDSVWNGYVTLTAFCEEGATNVSISDHKRIIVLTFSDEFANDCASSLEEAGYPQMDELVSIDCGIHHWHYRHPESRSRPELVQYLHSIGFSDWAPQKF